ncbi:hypothetical protein [Bacillus altitudinis]|nr:hypothetical protein [Bacillus altitudinis]
MMGDLFGLMEKRGEGDEGGFDGDWDLGDYEGVCEVYSCGEG